MTVTEMNGFRVGQVVKGRVAGEFVIVRFAPVAGEMMAWLRENRPGARATRAYPFGTFLAK